MTIPLKDHLIKKAKFDYYLNDGFEEGKGALQSFIDKLPAITQTILQGMKMTLEDEMIIYDATGVLEDIKIMSKKWDATISLMRKYLTPEQVSEAEINKSVVETLSVQLENLLLELQNACDTNYGGWATVMKDVTKSVDRVRRRRGGGDGNVAPIGVLLEELKSIGTL